MQPLAETLGHPVAFAQTGFARIIETALTDRGLAADQYVRYLSMQYHLTKGVQEYFYAAAAHSSLRRRQGLRQFLVEFANEEESHYLLAESDIAALGKTVLPEPLDVSLWHAYFRSVVHARPFIRLGATVVLENISDGAAKDAISRFFAAPFLSRENTRFIALHRHEMAPHGAQVVEVLQAARLTPEEQADLAKGAWAGAVLYLRMAKWAAEPDYPDF